MGRISASHVAGLDLIDKLFFNQTLVLCLFQEELVWLMKLHDDLDRELTHKGVTGVQRQVAKHGILCMLEVKLSESIFRLVEALPDAKLPALPENLTQHTCDKLERYKLDFFGGTLLGLLSKAHECDTLLVVEISNTLLGKYKETPATFRYRLVERMFSYEFPRAPINCFTWLAKMGVLKSIKHPGNELKARYTPEFLQRLALLCEFDMHRDYIKRATCLDDYESFKQIYEIKNISDKTRKILLAQAFKLIETTVLSNLKNSIPTVSLTKLEDPAKIKSFFSNLNTYAIRLRVFQGSLASWIGMLCGGYVEVLDRFQDQKKPIYCDICNKGSWTEYLSMDMKAGGFEITARTIYERNRDFKETILQNVGMYYNFSISRKMVTPPEMKDLAYYGLAPNFGQFKPKPRRGLATSQKPRRAHILPSRADPETILASPEQEGTLESVWRLLSIDPLTTSTQYMDPSVFKPKI